MRPATQARTSKNPAAPQESVAPQGSARALDAPFAAEGGQAPLRPSPEAVPADPSSKPSAIDGLADALARVPMPSMRDVRLPRANLPRPRTPRLFTTVAMAAACLLMLKGADLFLGAPLVDGALAQSMLGPEPPVLRKDGPRTGETEIYIESAGRETPEQTPTSPLDIVPTETVLGERIADRRRLLTERERELDMRESLLKAAETRIEEQIGSLRAMELRAENGPVGPDGMPAPDADMDRIVTMYEAMKAKEAARILAELDMEVLEAVARRMNPRKLADVMGEMDAKPATRLTVRLAGARSAPAASLKPSVPVDLPVIQGEMPR